MMEHLGRQLNISPWTCEPVKVLEVHQGHLLAAEGSNVLIWPLNVEHRNPTTVKVFPNGCPITSLSCNSSEDEDHVRILVTSLYFYREIVFKNCDNTTIEVKLGNTFEGMYGEIIAGRCLNSNAFIVYDLNNRAVLHEVEQTDPIPRTSVYKGHLAAPDSVSITGSTKSDIIIFVATSSSVSICKLCDSDGQADNEIQSMYTFCQPKGVIFSVNFYRDFNLVITTSDDRSISLWNCVFPGKDGSLPADWESVSVTLQGTLEGHTSRIFNAILLPDHIVSVGEDSKIVVWSLNDLTRHRVIGNHSGCTVWSCAYDQLDGGIFTGGDNGAIFHWNMSQLVQNYEETEYCELHPAWFSTNIDIAQHPPVSKSKPKQDYPRLVKSYDEKSSVVTTDSGKVLIVDKDSVRYCHQTPSWQGYLTFSWYPGKEIYVTGTLSGTFSFNKVRPLGNGSNELVAGYSSKFKTPNSEVISTHFISGDELLLSTVTSLLMYEVCMTEDESGNINFKLMPKVSLKWSAKQKSNANCVTAWENVMFVGLDNGKIKAYDRKTGERLYKFKARHNKYGVGGIIEYEGNLVTGGRDSSLNFFFIEEDFGVKDFTGLEPVTHLKTVPIPFLWVGTLLKYRGDLLVCGFDSADFVIYSFRREQIIARTHCGGAHRAWDFLISENGTGFFTHIRNRHVYKVCFHLDHCITNCVKEGFHLEDINSVIKIGSSSGTKIIIASGSEDGAVKISTFRIEGGNGVDMGFVKVKTDTITSHSSAVKCLHFQELRPNEEGYVLSGGGKSELVLTKLYLDGGDLKKYCRRRRFEFDEEVDFRIMDIKSILAPNIDWDTNVPGADKLILVGFIACSDGIIRFVRDNGRFKFSRTYQKGTGANHCLTTVEILQSGSPYELDIFCGTSNGEILSWKVDFKLSDIAESFWSLKGGIPANRIYKLSTVPVTAMNITQSVGKALILVGGDDGSLHRIYAADFLSGNHQKQLQKVKLTNGGLLGMQHCLNPQLDSLTIENDNNLLLYFISDGKLYKCDISLNHIHSVRIPVQDAKGIQVCSPLNYCNIHCTTCISFGKGISMFVLK